MSDPKEETVRYMNERGEWVTVPVSAFDVNGFNKFKAVAGATPIQEAPPVLNLGDQDMQARIQFGQRLIEYGETPDAQAEGYYLAGMIETAIQLTTDELKRTEYQNALEALSSHKCECRKDGFVTERIVYNGQVYSLIKCPNCGALTTQ